MTPLHLNPGSAYDTQIRIAGYRRTSPETLQSIALEYSANGHQDDIFDVLTKNPNTPPLVKVWAKGGYSGMSLKEFLDVTRAKM